VASALEGEHVVTDW